MTEHIEASAGNGVVTQGIQQSCLINDLSARGVDQIGVTLHQAQLVRPDQAARTLAENKVDRDDVRLTE